MIKEIDNHKGYYISDDGNVYCELGKGNRDKNKTKQLYKLKPRITKTGYFRICARNNLTNKRDDLYIHRLVATYFIDNPDNKKTVNHKNFDKSDNRAENLEWMTLIENVENMIDAGRVYRDKTTGRFVSNIKTEE